MTMKIEQLGIADVKLVTPTRHSDERGYFCESWNEQDAFSAGIHSRFVQDNHAMSVSNGTVRGLHYQREPFAQGKLVRVLKGKIFDVAVDIRIGSATFGQWVGAELGSDDGRQIWIPRGFAHGYCTLEPFTEVLYKTDAYYNPAAEAGIRWDDPDIGINWPRTGQSAILSSKDRTQPRIAAIPIAELAKLDPVKTDDYDLRLTSGLNKPSSECITT